jgi:uncharacterized repeat protein (TIGR01451 family)
MRLGPHAPDAGQPPQNVVEASFEGRARCVGVVPVRAPELAWKVTAPEATFVGERVLCRIDVTNKGSAPARDVTVQTLLPEGLAHPFGPDLESSLGTLGPGEQRTVPLEATATRPGDLQLRVSVQAKGARPTTQTALVRASPNPLTVTVAGPKVLQNQLTGLYELTVRNEGPATVREVALAVTVPAGMEFVRAGGGGGYDPGTRLLRWELGELGPAEERIVAWNGAARSCGDLELPARLTVGGRPARELAWVTRVVSGEPARPAAPGAHGNGH